MRALRTITVAAICAVYLAVRLWGLTDSCLWFDEIFGVHAAEHSWSSILSFVAVDLIHPPPFYLLLKLWIGVGGESLFWLRLFPVVFAVIAIFPFLSLCRELKIARWAAALALFLFAVNGSLIKYAQEVRMYSALMCLSLFSMWLFARYFNRGKGLVPLIIVNVLMVYSHYFGWFVVLSEVALILWLQRVKWRAITLMFAITFAAFLPWMIVILLAAGSGSGLSQNIGWMTRPGLRQVVTLLLNLAEPFYYQASTAEPVSRVQIAVPILLTALVAITFYVLRKVRVADEKARDAVLITFFVMPVAAVFAASWLLPYSIWGTRHLTIVFAPILIFLSVAIVNNGVAALRIGSTIVLLLLSASAFSLRAVQEDTQYPWCAWERLAVYPAATDNKVPIVALEDMTAYHLWFALRDDRTPILKLGGFDEDKAYFLPRGFDEVTRVEQQELTADRFWLAFRAQKIDISEPPLRYFLERGYKIADQQKILVGPQEVGMILLEN
ncbi:MAG: glycosyltransferase family 39 protein [Pyrinomonadaceae bacterium]